MSGEKETRTDFLTYTQFLATYTIFEGLRGREGWLPVRVYRRYLGVKREEDAIRIYRDPRIIAELAEEIGSTRGVDVKVRLEPRSLEKITTTVLHEENSS